MASLTHKKLANFYHNWFFVVAAISILAFGMIEFLIVSIPDFPLNAYAWELQLWSESSGYWSEVTWLVLFVIFGIFLALISSLSSEIRRYPAIDQYRKLFFYVWMLSFGIMTVHFIGYYSITKGETWVWSIAHGWFYLLTTYLGFLLVAETTAYVIKCHRDLERLVWRLS